MLKRHISIMMVLIAVAFVIIINHDDGYLRGSVTFSEDGETYLSVEDDNGGRCDSIFVDGKFWRYKVNEVGPIAPGIHTIECGTEIDFSIPKGVIFHFDYWGSEPD